MHVIELFISAHCPGSSEASRILRVFSGQHEDVHLIEREVETVLELAGQYGLFATPATVIDGQHVLYGVPSAERLKRYIALTAHTCSTVDADFKAKKAPSANERASSHVDLCGRSQNQQKRAPHG